MDVKQIGYKCVDWKHIPQDTVQFKNVEKALTERQIPKIAVNILTS